MAAKTNLNSARIIGIDVSSVPYGTGVSNYTLNIVRNLVKIDKHNTYKLFFSSLRQPIPEEIKKLIARPNVKLYRFYFPPTFMEFIWNRLHWFPIELFIGKCNLFHTWDWTQPPTIAAKTITTIHDFVPFLYPKTQHTKTIAVFKRKFNLAIKECAAFICVSHNTKSDLLKLFPKISKDKVHVIYEAAEQKYDEFNRLSENEKKQKKTLIFQQYGLKHFILAQGTREPRKNLERLIKAFILYKKRNPKSTIELAISGKYGWGNDLDIGSHNSIKVLGYIPEKDMAALHASALCLCYPSLYEGFGLPIVKSMKVGTPVITSRNSSLEEIAGNAALLVDPTNINDLSLALEKIIASPVLRHKLISKGYQQSQKFSWQKAALETLQVYTNLLKN